MQRSFRLPSSLVAVTMAALLSAGYDQHKRGEWRKRRGQKEESP